MIHWKVNITCLTRIRIWTSQLFSQGKYQGTFFRHKNCCFVYYPGCEDKVWGNKCGVSSCFIQVCCCDTKGSKYLLNPSFYLIYLSVFTPPDSPRAAWSELIQILVVCYQHFCCCFSIKTIYRNWVWVYWLLLDCCSIVSRGAHNKFWHVNDVTKEEGTDTIN